MSSLISAVLLALITIPIAIAIIILGRNELEISQKVTGGTGVIVIIGFFVIFVVAPIWAFLAS